MSMWSRIANVVRKEQAGREIDDELTAHIQEAVQAGAIRRTRGRPLVRPCGTALSAQCVMCYRTAEGQNHARAMILNKAIIILGAPPFLILAGFIVYVFKSDKRGELVPGNESDSLRS
jgi:hypothetical protein